MLLKGTSPWDGHFVATNSLNLKIVFLLFKNDIHINDPRQQHYKIYILHV